MPERFIKRGTFAAVAATLGACTSVAVPPADHDLPEVLRAGPEYVLQSALEARGQAIFNCKRDGDVLHWRSDGFRATLVDDRRHSVGTVAPGGYFLAYDNSYVITRPIALAQVSAGGVPWARLDTRYQASPRRHEGRFGNTALVQRVRTVGGIPPRVDCNIEGSALYVPYSATYLFYTLPAGTQPALPRPATLPSVPASAAPSGHYPPLPPL